MYATESFLIDRETDSVIDVTVTVTDTKGASNSTDVS